MELPNLPANQAPSNRVQRAGFEAEPAMPLAGIPDYVLLRRIGRGAYGEVWLAQNFTGSFVAVKIVARNAFDHDRPFEREFEGIKQFEPISRSDKPDGLFCMLDEVRVSFITSWSWLMG